MLLFVPLAGNILILGDLLVDLSKDPIESKFGEEIDYFTIWWMILIDSISFLRLNLIDDDTKLFEDLKISWLIIIKGNKLALHLSWLYFLKMSNGAFGLNKISGLSFGIFIRILSWVRLIEEFMNFLGD